MGDSLINNLGFVIIVSNIRTREEYLIGIDGYQIARTTYYKIKVFALPLCLC